MNNGLQILASAHFTVILAQCVTGDNPSVTRLDVILRDLVKHLQAMNTKVCTPKTHDETSVLTIQRSDEAEM